MAQGTLRKKTVVKAAGSRGGGTLEEAVVESRWGSFMAARARCSGTSALAPRIAGPLGILPLALLALFAATCSAQSDYEPDRRSSPVNSIQSGATSLQFLTFGGGYQTPFRTNGFFVKTHLSDRVALRIGTAFSISQSHGDSPPSPLPSIRNDDSYSVSISTEFEEYVDATGPVTVFIGLGPYWSRSHYTSESVRYRLIASGYSIDSYREENKSWELGGSAAVGFEWFFRRKLSVLGRVGASFGFGKEHTSYKAQYGDISYPYTDSLETDTNTASASSSSAALGLGLYF